MVFLKSRLLKTPFTYSKYFSSPHRNTTYSMVYFIFNKFFSTVNRNPLTNEISSNSHSLQSSQKDQFKLKSTSTSSLSDLSNNTSATSPTPPSIPHSNHTVHQFEQTKIAQDSFKSTTPTALSPKKTSYNPTLSEEEINFLAEKARRSEELWNTLVPERKMTYTSPIFWVLLAAVIILHFYNNYRDEQRNIEDTKEYKLEQIRKLDVEELRRKRELKEESIQ